MSKLRGELPELTEQRLKCFMYGVAGGGKTMAAISFPKPYLIDTEKGWKHKQYHDKLKENGGVVFHTTSFIELVDEVKSLGTQKHDYKTLIIDPLTTIYNDLLEECARKRISPSNPDGMAHGGHYIVVNTQMKMLMTLLIKLDMNVIITAHSKTEYGANMAVLGTTFDCFRKIDYLFDLVLEIAKKGKFREAIVKKSRIDAFQEADRFTFSYEEIAKRYGKDILEKECEAIQLATPSQLAEFAKLNEKLQLPLTTITKWLEKANASYLPELTFDQMGAIINHLKTKQGN